MSLLVALDQWILGEFERFAHAFQRLTGKGPMYLFAAATVIGMAAVISSWRALIDLVLGYLIAYPLNVSSYYNLSGSNAGKEALRNPLGAPQGPMFILRLIYLFLSLANPFLGVWGHRRGTVIVVSFWAAVNFLCCTPLPPCKSKIKEWIAALKARPAVDTAAQQV